MLGCVKVAIFHGGGGQGGPPGKAAVESRGNIHGLFQEHHGGQCGHGW